MSYVYAGVDDLDGHNLVGTGQCVVLVQAYTAAPRAAHWKQGVSVRGQLLLTRGTAIATFVDGVYRNHAQGNHAAFYLGQDQGGIRVMDQWRGDPKKPTVSRRYLQFKGSGKDGNWIDTSNNADAFSVIE
jgi:hypothetical protein